MNIFNILTIKSVVLFIILLTYTCGRERYIEITNPCNDEGIKKEIVQASSPSEAMVQSGYEILFENYYYYNLKLELPNRFEFCGEIPIFMCSVGEPDKYYAIDTSLNEELFIIVETNKFDQIQYEALFPHKKDSIDRLKSKEQLAHDDAHVQAYMNKLNLKNHYYLTPTTCTINDSEFVGYGFKGISNRGHYHAEYGIYGYKGEILYGLKYRRVGQSDQININELYCIMNGVNISYSELQTIYY